MRIPQKPVSLDYERLAQTLLFKDLARAELDEIVATAQSQKVSKGAFFFMQGDDAGALYLLVTGQVKLAQVNPDGQQTLLRAIGDYALFGAVVLAQAQVYPVSAEAMEDSLALVWSKQDLMPFVGRFAQFAMNAIQVMAFHSQEFQERFRQLATERVERRLAHTLLRLASQTGKKIPEGVLVNLPLTRQDLAEMSGTTLYTVSRLLSQWESQGWISAERGRFIIRYPHALVSLAEDLPVA
jgi:CRP/FNR family transcriptional regulator, nitrogen oxide reductase regulator